MEPGRVLSDRYELAERLGSGGMAEVFVARDRVLDRDVAVKLLLPYRAADEDFVRRFRREARSAASLNHPNVVSVHDTGADGDAHYIVMELIDGPTLDTVIAERAPLPTDEVVDVVRQVCGALDAAHAAGLVHRDIKPGNIMFDASGDVKVTDFGIALATAASRLTRTSDVYGSAPYLAPEQARGDDVDGRADLYALGCVTYAMLTGDPPFTGAEPISIVYQHLHGDIEPPSARRDDVPTELDDIVMGMLARDADQRYASARQVREDLDRVPLDGPSGAVGAVGDTRRLSDDDETVAMSAAGAPAAAGAAAGETTARAGPAPGAPETTAPREGGAPVGKRPRWRSGLALVAGIVLLAALLALTVMRTDPATEPDPVAGATEETSPTPDPTPSPPPPPSLEQAVVGLYEVTVVGQQQGEVSDKAAEDLRKVAEDALDKYREGKVEDALEKLDEGREKIDERTREGEIDPDRARAMLAAVDEVEEALRREAPPPADEDDEDDGGRGNGDGD